VEIYAHTRTFHGMMLKGKKNIAFHFLHKKKEKVFSLSQCRIIYRGIVSQPKSPPYFKIFFDVARFKYLGRTEMNRNYIVVEIKSILNFGNGWYYSVQRILYSRLYLKVQRLKFTKL